MIKYDYEMNFNDINSQVYNILKFITPHSQILDIGCAGGRLGNYLKTKLNCYVVGIDINSEYSSFARKNLDEFYIMDVNNLNLVNNFIKQRNFDFIILADVVEHLILADEFLSMISMTTNANIILSVPNISFWETRLKLCLGIFEYTESGIFDKTHLHFYNLYYARKIVRKKFHILNESHSSWYTPSEKLLNFRSIPIIKNMSYYIKRFLTSKFPNFYASQLIFLLKSKNIDKQSYE